MPAPYATRKALAVWAVREWLRSLSRKDRKIIGDDIKTAQFGWPLGMPLIRKLDKDLNKTITILIIHSL